MPQTPLLNYPTIVDYRDRMDPTGAPAQIVQLLHKINPFAAMLPAYPTNDVDSEKINVQVSLPTVVMKAYGQPVAMSKGEVDIQSFPTGIAETIQQAPVDIVELGGDPQQYLLNDAEGYLEAMRQKQSSQLISGDHVANVNEIMGFSKYFNSTTGNLAGNMISAGDSGGTLTSVYFIGLGRNGFYTVFPKNVPAGLVAGPITRRWSDVTEGTTVKQLEVFTRKYQQRFGLVARNYTNGVRICNIDHSKLAAGTSTVDLIQTLRKAPYRIKDETLQYVWLMNASTMEYLDNQSYLGAKAGGGLLMTTVGDRTYKSFAGFPILRTDSITNSESTIS